MTPSVREAKGDPQEPSAKYFLCAALWNLSNVLLVDEILTVFTECRRFNGCGDVPLLTYTTKTDRKLFCIHFFTVVLILC